MRDDYFPDKDYYTEGDLARYYFAPIEHIHKLIKDGIIKTVNVGNQYMVIPHKTMEKMKKDLDWILGNYRERHFQKLKEKSITKSDKLRQAVVGIMINFIIPVIVLLSYVKIMGYENANNYIALILVVLSATIAKLLYEYLFPKYYDDVDDIL